MSDEKVSKKIEGNSGRFAGIAVRDCVSVCYGEKKTFAYSGDLGEKSIIRPVQVK